MASATGKQEKNKWFGEYRWVLFLLISVGQRVSTHQEGVLISPEVAAGRREGSQASTRNWNGEAALEKPKHVTDP